jgi:hypothetical protein
LFFLPSLFSLIQARILSQISRKYRKKRIASHLTRD